MDPLPSLPRRSGIKSWKIIEGMYVTKDKLRSGAEISLTVNKEAPIREGKHGDWAGDTCVRAHIQRGNLNLHFSWPELLVIRELIEKACSAIGPDAEACEHACEASRQQRLDEKATREKEWIAEREEGFGNRNTTATRRTGKTERDRQKRQQRARQADHSS